MLHGCLATRRIRELGGRNLRECGLVQVTCRYATGGTSRSALQTEAGRGIRDQVLEPQVEDLAQRHQRGQPGVQRRSRARLTLLELLVGVRRDARQMGGPLLAESRLSRARCRRSPISRPNSSQVGTPRRAATLRLSRSPTTRDDHLRMVIRRLWRRLWTTVRAGAPLSDAVPSSAATGSIPRRRRRATDPTSRATTGPRACPQWCRRDHQPGDAPTTCSTRAARLRRGGPR